MRNQKFRKKIICFFIVVIICFSFNLVAVAVDYSKLPISVIKHINVRNLYSNILRSAGFSILVLIGQLIDIVYVSVNTVCKLNLYEAFKNIPFLSDNKFFTIAWAVLSFALIIAAIFLMVNPSKLKLSDLTRNTIISIVLLMVFPTIYDCVEDLKNSGVKDVDTITITATDTNSTLGEQMLSGLIIDLPYSASRNTLEHYSYRMSVDDTAISPYYIDINAVMDNKDFSYKVDSIDDSNSKRQKYSELTTANKMTLLVLHTYYSEYVATGEIYDSGEATGIDSVGRPIYENARTLTGKEAEMFLIQKISENGTVSRLGLSENVLACNNLSAALDAAEAAIKELNTVYNDKVTLNADNIVGQYQLTELMTQDEFDDLNSFDKLWTNIKTGGYGVEYIYAYDYMFILGLVFMLVTLVCLCFAGFKIVATLFDLVFIQLIAPIVFASDVQGSGRTKKLINELISSALIIVTVLLIFKAYLIVLIWMLGKNFNIIIQLFLIFGGAKFVIDGPDLVTKLLGIDAGIKSGYGAVAGMQTAMHMAGGAMHTARNTIHNVGRAVTAPSRAVNSTAQKLGTIAGRMDNIKAKTPDKYTAKSEALSAKADKLRQSDKDGNPQRADKYDRKAQKYADKANNYDPSSPKSSIGAFVGAITGDNQQGKAGQAFRSARNQVNDNNARYNDYMSNQGMRFENVKGEKGDTGLQGQKGEKGEKGDVGVTEPKAFENENQGFNTTAATAEQANKGTALNHDTKTTPTEPANNYDTSKTSNIATEPSSKGTALNHNTKPAPPAKKEE